MHIFSCAALVVCAVPLVLATPMPYGSTSGPDVSNGAARSLRPRHISARAPKSPSQFTLAAKKCDNSRKCGDLHGQCKAAIARIDKTAVYLRPTTLTSLIPGPENKGGCAISLACRDNNFGEGITGLQVALLFEQLYTDAGGAHCQECGSGEVEGVVGLPDNNCMVQAVFCKDCKDVNVGTPNVAAPLRPSPTRSNLPFASLPPFPGPSTTLPAFPMGTGTPDGGSFEPIFDDGLSGNPPFDLRILDTPLQRSEWPADPFEPSYSPRRNRKFPWIPADWSLRPDPPVNFLGDPSWWDSTTGPSTGGNSPWGPDSNTGFGSPMFRPRPSSDNYPPTFPGGSLDGPASRFPDPNTGSRSGPVDPSLGSLGGFTDPSGETPGTPGNGSGSPDTSGSVPGLSGGGSMGTPGSPSGSTGTSPPSSGGDQGSPGSQFGSSGTSPPSSGGDLDLLANVPASTGGSSSTGGGQGTSGSPSGSSGGAPGLSGGGSRGTPGSQPGSSGTSPPSSGGDPGSPANVPGSPGGSSSGGAVPDTPGSPSGESGALTTSPSGPTGSSGGSQTTKGGIPGSLADVPVGSGGPSGSGGVPNTPGSPPGSSPGASSPKGGSPSGTGGNPGSAGGPLSPPSDSSSSSGGNSGAGSTNGKGPSPPSGSNSGGTPPSSPPPTGGTASVAPPANPVATAAGTVSSIPTIPGQSGIF